MLHSYHISLPQNEPDPPDTPFPLMSKKVKKKKKTPFDAILLKRDAVRYDVQFIMYSLADARLRFDHEKGKKKTE